MPYSAVTVTSALELKVKEQEIKSYWTNYLLRMFSFFRFAVLYINYIQFTEAQTDDQYITC